MIYVITILILENKKNILYNNYFNKNSINLSFIIS